MANQESAEEIKPHLVAAFGIAPAEALEVGWESAQLYVKFWLSESTVIRNSNVTMELINYCRQRGIKSFRIDFEIC